MKLAIVHDFLLSYGGAERVLEHVHELYPDAPVYTLRYNPAKMHHRMNGWNIVPSVIEKMPIINKRGHTLAMPLYPVAIENFDLSQFDVVLSLSSAFAHGAITQPGTVHICYYHTPTRFLWDYHYQYLQEKGWDKGLKGATIQRFLHRLREWDFLAAQRPDILLANSQTVVDRIQKFYRRDASIINPGVDISHSTVAEPQSGDSSAFYLTISRLTPPKRLELAVAACTHLNRPLHVIGVGEEMDRLKSIAGPSVKFLGFLSDKEVISQISRCRALLFPGIDDFGLVPVEVMSYGKPVIAYNKGGATETVINNKTGILFDTHSTEGMQQGIEDFEKIEAVLDPHFIHQHAQKFSKQSFQKQIKEVIEQAYQKVSSV